MKRELTPLLFFAFIAFVILNGIPSTEAVVPQRNYTNCMVVDYGYNLRLYWTLQPSNQISMAMSADVTGYISLGFSTDGTMGNGGKGADAWAVCLTSRFSHSRLPMEFFMIYG